MPPSDAMVKNFRCTVAFFTRPPFPSSNPTAKRFCSFALYSAVSITGVMVDASCVASGTGVSAGAFVGSGVFVEEEQPMV